MSPVLDIDTLLESPLADLHALAGELDIEGYRLLRKADLTIAILEQRGAIGDEIRPAVEAKAAELATIRAERERELAEREEAEEEAREAAREEAARQRRESSAPRGEGRDRQQRGEGRERQQRGQRGGRGRGGDRRPGERPERTQRERTGRDAAKTSTGGDTRRERGGRDRDGRGRDRETKPAESDLPLVAISGVFEPGSGGGGRLRTDLARRTRGDADVQRAEVRKWRLHRGDTIVGEARKVKRGRTDYQLVAINAVNGLGQPPAESKRVRFSEADAAPAATGKQFSRKLFKHAPVFTGSRVIVTGPTRAAASEMLGRLAEDLAGSGVTTTLIVSVARPDGTAQGASGYDLVVNEPGKSAEDVLSAIELAIERGKRLAESGGDAAVLIDGLDLLPTEKVDELAGASRNLAQHGSLTVIGSAGTGSALEAQATTIAVVAGGRRLKLDKKASWSADK